MVRFPKRRRTADERQADWLKKVYRIHIDSGATSLGSIARQLGIKPSPASYRKLEIHLSEYAV